MNEPHQALRSHDLPFHVDLSGVSGRREGEGSGAGRWRGRGKSVSEEVLSLTGVNEDGGIQSLLLAKQLLSAENYLPPKRSA